jgi:hypothetical protein
VAEVAAQVQRANQIVAEQAPPQIDDVHPGIPVYISQVGEQLYGSNSFVTYVLWYGNLPFDSTIFCKLFGRVCSFWKFSIVIFDLMRKLLISLYFPVLCSSELCFPP